MQKVAVFYVVTGKYLVFWPDFLATAEQALLPGCEVHYFVFTDVDVLPGQNGVCPPLSEKALAALGGAARGCARSGADGAPDRGADANAHTHANAYPGAHGNADPNTDAHARADPDRIYDLHGGRLHACELSAGALLCKLL